MWIITLVTIVSVNSSEPKPYFEPVGITYNTLQECYDALAQRETNEVRLIQNTRGELVLFGQARGYMWAEGCVRTAM
jgi:hypothetical protein